MIIPKNSSGFYIGQDGMVSEMALWAERGAVGDDRHSRHEEVHDESPEGANPEHLAIVDQRD